MNDFYQILLKQVSLPKDNSPKYLRQFSISSPLLLSPHRRFTSRYSRYFDKFLTPIRIVSPICNTLFLCFCFFFCHFENMKDDFDYVLEGVCHVCQDFCNEFCSGSVINGLKLPKGIVRPSVTECPVSPCSGHKTPAN